MLIINTYLLSPAGIKWNHHSSGKFSKMGQTENSYPQRTILLQGTWKKAGHQSCSLRSLWIRTPGLCPAGFQASITGVVAISPGMDLLIRERTRLPTAADSVWAIKETTEWTWFFDYNLTGFLYEFQTKTFKILKILRFSGDCFRCDCTKCSFIR